MYRADFMHVNHGELARMFNRGSRGGEGVYGGYAGVRGGGAFHEDD